MSSNQTARRATSFGLGLLTAWIAASGASAMLASAAALDVNGGVIQAFVGEPPTPPSEPNPIETCGDVSGYNLIEGTDDNDFLLGTEGPDLILGNSGHDLIVGFDGEDCLVGGAGNDVLFGQRKSDILLGGAGHDLILGGVGQRDELDGGDGKDWCYGAPEDIVRNCEPWPFDTKAVKFFELFIESLDGRHPIPWPDWLAPGKPCLPPWLTDAGDWPTWLQDTSSEPLDEPPGKTALITNTPDRVEPAQEPVEKEVDPKSTATSEPAPPDDEPSSTPSEPLAGGDDPAASTIEPPPPSAQSEATQEPPVACDPSAAATAECS